MPPNSRISARPRSSRITASRRMGGQVSHQATWKKSVFQVYQEASIPFEWTPVLKEACDKAGIDYFSSPYDFEAIDMLDPYVPTYKSRLRRDRLARGPGTHGAQGQTVSSSPPEPPTIGDVQRAVHAILSDQPAAGADAVQYQLYRQPGELRPPPPERAQDLCHHVPGGDPGAFRPYPRHGAVLGRGDPGSAGDRAHFTDEQRPREGPDHKFAMNPENWAKMVEDTRLLERALGSADKFIAGNEKRDGHRPAPLPAGGAGHPGGRDADPRDDRCAAPRNTGSDLTVRDRSRDRHHRCP